MKWTNWFLILILHFSFLCFCRCDNNISDIMDCGFCSVLGVKNITALGDGLSVKIVYAMDVDENSSQSIANYTITTTGGEPIQVIDATRDENDFSTVVLTTTGLVGSENFILIIRNVNGVSGTKPIPENGLEFPFELVVSTMDTTPPNYVSPPTGTIFTTTEIILQWTSRVSATEYIVEIATDEEFSNQVPGSPFKTSSTYTLVQTLPGDYKYYWRVRANTTTPGEYSNLGGKYATFSLLTNDIYVYCPHDQAICSDAEKIGNISSPLQTITGAIDKAKQYGLTSVKVASRGNDQPYKEIIIMEDGISLLGAYTADFAEENRDIQNNRTLVQSRGSLIYGTVCILADGIQQSTLLEGFEIHGMQDNNNAISCHFYNCSSSFIINSNTIVGASSVFQVSYALKVEQSELQITKNDIKGPDVPSSMGDFGLYIVGSDISIIGNNILGSNGASGYGIYTDEYSNLKIMNNFIDAGGSTNSVGINMSCPSSIICNNVIVSNGSSTAYGISLVGSGAEIYNNIIKTAGGSSHYTIYCENSSTPIICNNLLMGDGASITFGIYEQDIGSEPSRILNNNFFNLGSSDRLYFDCDTSSELDLTEINSLPGSGGNIDEDLTSSLDTDYRFTGDLGSFTFDTAGINGGHSTYNWDFGSIGYTDFDGTNRTPQDDSSTTGWSIGPYEYDG